MDSIVFLLIMISASSSVISIHQTSAQSYSEFNSVTSAIVKHIPALLTAVASRFYVRKCTPILITLVKVYHNELPFLYHEVSQPVLLSTNPVNLRRSNANMKYLPQCSFVVYYKLNADNQMLKLDLNWLLEIPGVEFQSFHFLVLEKEPDPELWQRPFIRRLSNAVAIILTDLSSTTSYNQYTMLVPNRHRSQPLYFNCGIMNEKTIVFSSQVLSKNRDIFWNKWRDLNGQEITVAVPPTQSEATFRDCREGRECQYPVSEMMESTSFINATPQVLPVSIATGFGRPYPNGSWDSYMGKIMDDIVEFSSPFSPTPYQYGHVFTTKPIMFSKVRFLTPLPVKADTSGISFLTEAFDKYVWTAIFICIAANTLALYFVTANSRLHPLRLSIMGWNNWEWIEYLTLRMADFALALIDVSVPLPVVRKRTSTTGIRILFAVWLLSIIVLADLFTSTSISILVEPVYIQPPKTVAQLVKSDFQLNGVLFKALLESGMPWTQKLKHPVKDFGIDFIGCLKTILKESNACIFVYNWLYLLSPMADLVDASGRQLFLSSEDVTRSYASSFCVSHRNPQLKQMLDKVSDAVVEGGMNLYWLEALFYSRSLKGISRHRKKMVAVSKITLVDEKLLTYPLVMLVFGILLGGVSCLIEYLHHKRTAIKVEQFPIQHYASGNDRSLGIRENFSKISKQFLFKLYPSLSNGFNQTPTIAEPIPLSPFLLEALRGDMTTVY